MDNIFSLPPLVQGKVLGFLKLAVLEINISKNKLFTKEHCELVQINWWGDKTSTILQSEKSRSKNCLRNSIDQEVYSHIVIYEIKTSLDLFEAYLENCEILELVVLKANDNFVIGSAILRNLVNLIREENKLILLPVIDFTGEKIGELKIDVNFFFNSPNKKNYSYTTDNFSHLSTNDDLSNVKILQNVRYKNGSALKIDKRFLDNYKPSEMIDLQNSKKVDVTKAKSNYNKGKSPPLGNALLSENKRNCFEKEKIDKKTYENSILLKKFSKIDLPQIHTQSDFSKVLSFQSVLNKTSTKIKKQPKTHNKQPHRINENISCKAYKCNRSSPKKRNSSFNKYKCSFEKFSNSKPQKHGKQQALKVAINQNNSCSKCEKQKSFKSVTSQTEPFLFEITSHENKKDLDILNVNKPKNCIKDGMNKNILNYLLGFDMTQEDEKQALKELRSMSPSQNFVETLHEYYSSTNYGFHKSMKTNTIGKISRSNKEKKFILNYNFENPIEKKYFEKFFSKVNLSPAFEIAKLLNKQEVYSTSESDRKSDNSFPTETVALRDSKKNNIFLNYQKKHEYGKCFEDESSEVIITDSAPETCESNSICCDYYNKVTELDKIIESLNHFEKKNLFDENQFSTLIQSLSL